MKGLERLINGGLIFGGGGGAITGQKKLFQDKLDSNADQNTIWIWSFFWASKRRKKSNLFQYMLKRGLYSTGRGAYNWLKAPTVGKNKCTHQCNSVEVGVGWEMRAKDGEKIWSESWSREDKFLKFS